MLLLKEPVRDETHFPPQCQEEKEDARLPRQDENQERKGSPQAQTTERTEETCGLMKQTLGPRQRIRRTQEFSFLYKNGTRFRGRYFTLVYLENRLPFSRLGVVASRKVGKAVARNKAKRRMRDLFRRNRMLLPFPMDIVAIARKEAAEVSMPDFQEDFLGALRSLKRGRPAR